jgi:hypothetical protein
MHYINVLSGVPGLAPPSQNLGPCVHAALVGARAIDEDARGSVWALSVKSLASVSESNPVIEEIFGHVIG